VFISWYVHNLLLLALACQNQAAPIALIQIVDVKKSGDVAKPQLLFNISLLPLLALGENTHTHSSGIAYSRQLKDNKFRKWWGEGRKEGNGGIPTETLSPLFCFPVRMVVRIVVQSKVGMI